MLTAQVVLKCVDWEMTSTCFDAWTFALVMRVSALLSAAQSSTPRCRWARSLPSFCACLPALFYAPEAINPVTPGHLGEHDVFLINNLLPPQMGSCCMRRARQTKKTAERPKTWHHCSKATVPIRTFAHLYGHQCGICFFKASLLVILFVK